MSTRQTHGGMPRVIAAAAFLSLSMFATVAHALITGAAGNDPVQERGWPKGSVDVANMECRIAWWEGPPLGGGEYHFEYSSDTDTFNKALEIFARIDAPKRRLVVYDGTAQSFWLNTNRDPNKQVPMDWTFEIWDAKSFNQLFGDRKNTFLSGSPNFGGELPPPIITVYTGGNIDWSKVKVPQGIEVVDERLEAHGYKLSDGLVVEASALDAETSKILPNTEVVVERIEPQETGGYKYIEVTRASANADGKIVLLNLPGDWLQISIRSKGYAPRLIDHLREDQPRWHKYETTLAKAIKVTGTVVDENGRPVPNANVRIDNPLGPDGKGYSVQSSLETKSDAKGRFTMDSVPAGSGRYRAYADDYIFKGLGEVVPLTEEPVTVPVVMSGKLKVTVDFGDKGQTEEYIVEVAPEGGERVGEWGGTAHLQKGTFTFTHIPPGRYTMHARPNPGNQAQQTDDVTAEIKGGETAEVTLKAK